ncbi:hypothetical protein AAMO2058_000129900 [Amorphochlora amoebiformis]
MHEESKKEANIEKATLPPFPLSSMVTGPPELHRKNRENSFRQGDTIGVRLDMIHGQFELHLGIFAEKIENFKPSIYHALDLIIISSY